MASPLRILMISGEYPPMEGGVADFTAIVAMRLAARGHDVQVLTSQRAADAVRERVAVHATMERWSWGPLYGRVCALARAFRPDVINIQYQAAAYGMHPAINLLPRVTAVPCVVTFHDLLVPYLFPKAGPLRWQAILALARGCRQVIVTNAEDRERLLAARGLPAVRMVPIGSNVAFRLPSGYDPVAWRARWGVPADALLLGYFGFLNASKGGEELVEALARLRRAGRDARLLMIGGAVGASDPTNRAYVERVRALITAQGLDEAVVWTGYLPDEQVSACFRCLDVCVLPYRDGVSFRRGSLMAALAHGAAIVSSQPRVALPEIIHGENMWLVPPEDPAALAEAIAALAADPGLRQRLGQGAALLARRFDWDAIAAETEDLLRAAVAPPKRGQRG
ncbi:MAG: glycosyltransferase family 4 protein [Chloroflexota bacterium]